ncbi:HAMP domain-containing histidine kinase [Myxococcota bacterium]|nr:HAMP domain-containing histidine kinase [Myxococcota bacterium]MBU1430501.1 HAMP domain-containing histidine kinase [Myxococcota bacterium]MBU1898221.1 HAMP domain-containing histidine kinase [Myxococcota bacterium]
MSPQSPEHPMSHRALSDQISATLVQALEGTARLLVGLRILALLLLLPGLSFWLYLGGERGWRLSLLFLAEMMILIIALVDLRRRAPLTPLRLALYAAQVFGLHSVIIAVTGGVESPVLPIYIPVTMVLAIAIGRGKALALNVLLLALLILGLYMARISGLGVGVPAALRAAAAPPLDPRLLGLTALCVVLFMGVGGVLGLKLRGRLDWATLAVAEAQAAAADARAETLAALKAQNRELATLSSALAHELKNPLAAIHSLSGLVARKLDEGSREAAQMEVLISEVKRLGGILDEFLNLSRPVDGLNATRTDPAALLRQIARLYEPNSRQRDVNLRVEALPCPEIHCDPRKIRQVLINLVENALRHSPPGGEVTLCLYLAPPCVCFSVRDQGPGLTSTMAARAFEAGFTTHPEGSGLGLTVARAIAHQHHGTLTLHAHPEGGAVAVLSLPLEAL